MTTPRRKAWDYMLDMMNSRFGSGDIGISDLLNNDENEAVCSAGSKLVADLKHQGPPKDKS